MGGNYLKRRTFVRLLKSVKCWIDKNLSVVLSRKAIHSSLLVDKEKIRLFALKEALHKHFINLFCTGYL